MKSWVITGGIGCGKSQVINKLATLSLGLVSFSADVIVAELLKKPLVEKELALVFGKGVLNSNGGGVNREWLREVVLPDPLLRARLESVLHPPVLEALESARSVAAAEGRNLFLAEVPLHYEIGATVSADFVIVVASSRSVQVRRMMENRGLDEQTVHQFLAAQWPIEAKVERADAVIWNDGSLASLEAQVLTLASPLLQA
ncbi:MAG: dephospho-CoA kinase [Prosthecobacter sp.]|uniref:dephospho-CoA kinase n=1 Tax=Prosthecobacter sp. TaxID=1965333 RepID=UPI001A003F4E|nr:dephospho-CoA kinase [Prosthecobacter sp.]MBE2284854.1 dephospho-CoA kinase [Prosthecobacter sp.]